jgi:CPA2 family monovalent cation:H+ antiporter-2
VETTAVAILEIGSVLLLAAIGGWIARRIGLPGVVGYLVVGLLVSPFTPGYVAEEEQIHLLADLGVVLLLFEVGIEVDLPRIGREQRGILWAAPLQVLITTAVVAVPALLLGIDTFGSLILGLTIALSSGVVIVNITRSRRRTTDRATEQALLGWSVLQDVTGVAAAAVILAVFGAADRSAGVALLGLVGFVLLALAFAWLLPRVLAAVRRQPDLFLIVSVASGLAVAGIGSVAFGVPLALAAFVAGLPIGETPASAEARRVLLPFRDLFAVLFFVAIGMLIDPEALIRGLPWLAFLLIAVIAGKVGVSYVLARLAGVRAHWLQLALGLGQVGEFGFVLSSIALAAGAITQELNSAILTTVAITIAASAILARVVRRPRMVEAVTQPAD